MVTSSEQGELTQPRVEALIELRNRGQCLQPEEEGTSSSILRTEDVGEVRPAPRPRPSGQPLGRGDRWCKERSS